MGDSREFSAQNKTFLTIAKQFRLGRFGETSDINLSDNCSRSSNNQSSSNNISSSSQSSDHQQSETSDSKHFNDVILELLQLQEDIGRLQRKEKLYQLSEKYSGLTNPSSSQSTLLQQIQELNTNLSFIINNSAKIQLKLANPAISNSLPLDLSLHECLVNLTNILQDMASNSTR